MHRLTYMGTALAGPKIFSNYISLLPKPSFSNSRVAIHACIVVQLDYGCTWISMEDVSELTGSPASISLIYLSYLDLFGDHHFPLF